MTTIDWAKLGAVLNEPVSGASVDTNVSMSHSGMNLSAALSFQPSPGPATWQVAPNVDGLTIAYSHESSDDSRDMMHIRSENGTFNYSMSGTVTGDMTAITLTLSAQATIMMSVSPGPTDAGMPLNIHLTMPYAITAVEHGGYEVTAGAPNLSDMSAPVYFNDFASAGVELTDDSQGISEFIMEVFEGCTNLSDPIAAVLNGQPA